MTITHPARGMNGFIEKISSLVQGCYRWREAPFASEGAARKWLQHLPGSSDYEAHHALVEGLERYNGDTRGDLFNRIRVLRAVEETGLPLQARMVGHYLQSQSSNESARQALWRECHLFWDQLAVAYQTFLNAVQRDGGAGKVSSLSPEIIVKSLRYFSLGMRWGYLRGRRPGESSWRRLHKIYRMAEISNVALGEVEVEGGKTSCAREYVMTLLFDLANPYTFGPEEIPAVLKILDGLQRLPVPETALRRDRHSHMVDLAASSGPEKIENRWMPGGRMRYLDLQSVQHELEQKASQAQDTARGLLCAKLANVIGREGVSRRSARKPRSGEVRAVFGTDSALKMFAPGQDQQENMPKPELVKLRDESSKGLGFVLKEDRLLPTGSLMSIERDDGGGWKLLAVRWMGGEDGQWLLGAEILSKYPRQVEIEWENGEAESETATAFFLTLASTSQAVSSNLLLPRAAYSSGRILLLCQDDGTRYRLKLGGIIEIHDAWLRVGFDVVSRDAAETD